jgi:hypothetical protein
MGDKAEDQTHHRDDYSLEGGKHERWDNVVDTPLKFLKVTTTRVLFYQAAILKLQQVDHSGKLAPKN